LDFGQHIRDLREAKSLSVRQVAAQLGLESSYLSKIEHGERLPSEAVLEALAALLGANPHILLAMTGRISKAFQEALRRHPEEFTVLLEKLQNAPKQTIVRVTRAVRDGDW
jgi:transcriptional regulator with XRE-family HTH domain